MVIARGLHKSYGAVAALRGFSLSVDTGEVVALQGPNGAGKTTALAIVAGLLRADRGELRKPPAPRIGYAPEEPAIWSELSPREQCGLVAGLYGAHPEAERTSERLVTFGLEGYADRPARTLSLGNRKRLNILLATLHHPRLLVLDEPFNGLDESGREIVRRWVVEFAAGGGAVLLASHQLGEVQNCADRIINLADGREVRT